jgi:hypothetical protein
MKFSIERQLENIDEMVMQRLGAIMGLMNDVIDLCHRRNELVAELKKKNEGNGGRNS